MGTDFFDGIVKTFSKTTKELGKTTKELGARAEQTIETQKIRGKISGRNGRCGNLYRDGTFYDGTLWLPGNKAIHEKHTHKEYIGVDACAVNLMRPAMYGAYHHITVMGKEDQPCDHMYDITGSLCENNDKFAIDRYLPKVDMGDLLVIHDTGAHGFAMGYNYNGKLKSAEILLHEDGSFEMIRRAETPKDYFATFDCFPIYEKLLEDMK